MALLFCTPSVFAWNAVGHRLIAQIAYNHLTRQEKAAFNRYNRVVDRGYMSKNMVNSAIWLDVIRYRTHHYDALHYIDIPFSTDGTSLPPIQSDNALQAIEVASRALVNPAETLLKKGTALRILVHIVGDIHQPLHAATRVSCDYPQGDKGGNEVILRHNQVAKNLHAYWDKGAGSLVGKRRYGQAWIKRRAIEIEKHWPCNREFSELKPMIWAQESYSLAVNQVYSIPHDHILNKHYQQVAKQIVERRIALAGCRLSGLLSDLYDGRASDVITAPKNRVASPPVTAL